MGNPGRDTGASVGTSESAAGGEHSEAWPYRGHEGGDRKASRNVLARSKAVLWKGTKGHRLAASRHFAGNFVAFTPDGTRIADLYIRCERALPVPNGLDKRRRRFCFRFTQHLPWQPHIGAKQLLDCGILTARAGPRYSGTRSGRRRPPDGWHAIDSAASFIPSLVALLFEMTYEVPQLSGHRTTSPS